MGQDWDEQTLTDFFKGAIDEVAFYDHELSQVKIKSLYTNGVEATPKKFINYFYDVGGNILSKVETEYSAGTFKTIDSHTYSYGDANWKDKLTAFDGKNITYDAIGNPLTYNGFTYTWEEGRQLKTISGNGITTSYKYNDAGIRTEKTVNGVTTKYRLVGDKVTFETNGTDSIYFTYDITGNLTSMNLNGTEYYYIRNGQGDIIGLIDGNKNQVVSYTYDSWGRLISIGGSLKDTLGVKNPYRYRGYRYDTETGLYYLQSRYYNPEWGRFVNADGIVTGNGDLREHNMFAYCGNHPINREDSSGYVWNIIGGALIGGVISGAISAISQLATTGSVNWKSVGVSVLSGAASGALAASGFGLLGQVIGNAAISGASYSADTKLNCGELYAKNIVANMIIGGTFGALGGKGYMHKSSSVKAVINQTNKTIERELRRANYKYAQKAIGRAITSSFDIVYKEGIKTTVTSIGSSGTSYIYSLYWAQTSPPIGDFPVYGQYAMAC